jgi:putative ABC transport system permease protein
MSSEACHAVSATNGNEAASSNVTLVSLRAAAPALYVPLRQLPFRNQNLVIRVSGDASAVVTGIRAALKTLDPDLPLDDVQTMSDRLRTAAGQPRFRTWLIALFGAVALVLAAIGVYGVLNSSVAQRTREIGIRAALGATRPQLIAMVLRESLALAGAGAIVGLAFSVVTGRLISSMLFEVSPTDVPTVAGATAILVSVAILSALLPPRRAAAVDPSAALRTE